MLYNFILRYIQSFFETTQTPIQANSLDDDFWLSLKNDAEDIHSIYSSDVFNSISDVQEKFNQFNKDTQKEILSNIRDIIEIATEMEQTIARIRFE